MFVPLSSYAQVGTSRMCDAGDEHNEIIHRFPKWVFDDYYFSDHV